MVFAVVAAFAELAVDTVKRAVAAAVVFLAFLEIFTQKDRVIPDLVRGVELRRCFFADELALYNDTRDGN